MKLGGGIRLIVIRLALFVQPYDGSEQLFSPCANGHEYLFYPPGS